MGATVGDSHEARPLQYWPGVTKLKIGTEPFNPDWDAAPTGRCTLTIEEGRDHVFAHDERGKMVGALKEEVLDRLSDRYVASTDQAHTPVGEARRRSFEEQEPQLGAIHGFATEIVLLLKRHSCEEEEEEEVKKTALQNHWTLPPEIMQALQEAFGIQAEVFASPLNVHSHMATYCSKFDRDTIFGSKGSAWDTQWGELGAFEFNPEYTAVDLDRALQPRGAHVHYGAVPGTRSGNLPGLDKNTGQSLLQEKFCPDPEGVAEIMGKALKCSAYCTVCKYHTLRNPRPANPNVHSMDMMSDMAAAKTAMDTASQYDVVFDPHPMRTWEIPSMSCRQ
ncbi:hypothetical protein CYMTET_56390 [Cymbomonas tetramitiformis]|uniref:PCIF1 WW domain-containing protein n=1 Tax=Cymbomonas tetramitiformis TaxID=36881 RepID=A0AAE0BB09_9CHLO|nr:hypothetical protein CYMTET_56390 [Cymbomonas tetramitiformis]